MLRCDGYFQVSPSQPCEDVSNLNTLERRSPIPYFRSLCSSVPFSVNQRYSDLIFLLRGAPCPPCLNPLPSQTLTPPSLLRVHSRAFAGVLRVPAGSGRATSRTLHFARPHQNPS